MALTAPTADLTGNTIASTYDQLLILDNAAGIVANTLKIVSTQLGHSALQIDDEKVLIKGVDTSNAIAFEVQEGADATAYISIGTGATTKGVTINESGQADIDFRVEASGSAHALFVDGTNGNVGIGAATPQYKLNVDGDVAIEEGHSIIWHEADTTNQSGVINVSSGDVMYFNNTSSSVTRMVILANGNIGIGANAPATLLNVAQSSATGTIVSIDAHYGNTVGGILRLQHSRNTAIGNVTTAVQSGDVLGRIDFMGADGDSWVEGAGILSATEEAWDSDSAGAYLQFKTCNTGNDQSTGSIERMRIMGNGNVGIGTSAPGAKLAINAPAMSSGNYNILNVTGTGNSVEAVFEAGIYYHSTQFSDTGGTNAPVAYMKMEASDGVHGYIWHADDDDLMASSNSAHIGTTNGSEIEGDMTGSDERLKDIYSGDFPYGLEEVNKLVPIKYKFKGKKAVKGDKLGFGAQTTLPILPETVKDTGICIHGYDYEKVEDSVSKSIPKGDPTETELHMQYTQIIPVLVKAVQELSAKVTALENA